MILYQVVQPFQYAISADTVNEAIKNFVKIHRNLNLNQIIITDQTNHWEAKMKYFIEDGRNRVGINAYPYMGPMTIGPSYVNWADNTLPGVTGIPLTPPLPAGSDLIFSPSIPYSPYGITNFVPTIIALDR